MTTERCANTTRVDGMWGECTLLLGHEGPCTPLPALVCVHCGEGLREAGTSGLHVHATGLQRCQAGTVPYGHMGHPAMPCPPGDINPCLGYREVMSGDPCTHVDARPDWFTSTPESEALLAAERASLAPTFMCLNCDYRTSSVELAERHEVKLGHDVWEVPS